jgi:hypothetical protein
LPRLPLVAAFLGDRQLQRAMAPCEHHQMSLAGDDGTKGSLRSRLAKVVGRGRKGRWTVADPGLI